MRHLLALVLLSSLLALSSGCKEENVHASSPRVWLASPHEAREIRGLGTRKSELQEAFKRAAGGNPENEKLLSALISKAVLIALDEDALLREAARAHGIPEAIAYTSSTTRDGIAWVETSR